MDGATSLVHASCIAVDGRAALFTGPSGAGKSDLALRCLGQSYDLSGRLLRAVLVADDQVLLERSGDRILARSPLAIAGKLEVRGVGIVDFPSTPQAQLDVIVELTDPTKIERLPEPGAKVLILGLELPVIRVAPFQASAPIKVLLSLVANVRPV